MNRLVGGIREFWSDVLKPQGRVTVYVLGGCLFFGGFGALVCFVDWASPPHVSLAIDITPYEVVGAALGLILVLRTNAGYDRWWEGRKLWGGIVNQSRNLAVSALAYGPADPEWRGAVVRWTIAFPHACRRQLRGERDPGVLAALLGREAAARVAEARHMPTYVARRVAELLREATDRRGLNHFAFLRIDRELGELVDHEGGCERILKTPMPRAYTIQTRRFIALYLLALPFALLDKIPYLTPLVTMLIAYPLLALDKIGAELQNPFSTTSLNHLPLDEICATVERDLFALLESPGEPPGSSADGRLDAGWPGAGFPAGQITDLE